MSHVCDQCGSLIEADSSALTFGDLTIGWRSVECRGQTLKLTPTERNFLVMLARRRRVSNEAVMAALFPDCFNEVIRVYVKRLRRKLESLGSAAKIACHYGWGYELTEGSDDAGLRPTH